MILTSSTTSHTMLVTSHDNRPSPMVLVPSSFDDDSKIETIPFIFLNLLQYLGVGYRWITMFLALGCYASLLIPGFIPVGCHYFSSSQVLRDIAYGDQPRNRLDLYLLKNKNGPKPVVAFITGGAWIIGNKAWGSLLGQQLTERDIIVACIDYRNFPQGTIGYMVKDVSQGISFVCNNIAEYGGDPRRYNWFDLVDHFHSRGLYRSIFLSIIEGDQGLKQYSPEVMVQDPTIRNAVSLLPPTILFHGTADYSIPCHSRIQ
ncbi:probable isoprenylcysteine alpha-carbonyl methylesterase ICMEL1 isoform X2 [Lycium barbarum]|uniref:probable isoprenylcysteine alpha-carbonyl methylesterase ICMEL1 isoform X2 n=1 Tax=Lycium barbarum TaxID=112863 RepID=UPI00293EA2ED|nr:probable isoprenylcysteine alpha-carbonyl methylesterase ICMEL1 isoform X2 [Lycium barbarum]